MYFDPVEAGKRIKVIRRSKGMTQMKFAEKLNISRSYMSKIEAGRKTASLDLIIEIAVYCGVTTDYLLMGQNLDCTEHKRELIQTMRDCVDDLERSL